MRYFADTRVKNSFGDKTSQSTFKIHPVLNPMEQDRETHDGDIEQRPNSVPGGLEMI